MKLPVTFLAFLLVAPVALAGLTDPIQNDAYTGRDASNSRANPTPLQQPGSAPGTERRAAGLYQGTLVAVDDPADWYSFELTSPGRVTLSFAVDGQPCLDVPLGVTTPDLLPFYIALVAPSGLPAAEMSFDDACGAFGVLDVPQAEPGLWRITSETPPKLAAAGLTGFAIPAVAPAGAGTAPVVAQYAMNLGCQPHC